MPKCLACWEPARWCGEGENSCGQPMCPHIHCDHCGMHFSLESEAANNAESYEEARRLMAVAYTALSKRDISGIWDADEDEWVHTPGKGRPARIYRQEKKS